MAPQAIVEFETAAESSAGHSKRTMANRRNAMRSTGPRSERGKDRSRRNALRTGLRARVVFPEEIRLEAERRVEEWTASRQPQDDLERAIVIRAANAMTMLDRCWAELEAARLRSAVHAEGFWERERQAEVVELTHKLSRDPARVVAKLRLSRQGAEWLMERWAELAERLRDGFDWTESQRTLALDLLGVRPEFRDDRSIVDGPSLEPQALIEQRLELSLEELGSLRLDIETFLEESDEIDRELRMKHLVVGVDPEVRRLERYERQLDHRVHACLRMLRELQAGRTKAEPVAKPEKPQAQPPPTPPVAPKRPPEVGGPESLDFLLPSVPPEAPSEPVTSGDAIPTPPRDMFAAVPSPARIALIAKLLEIDARTGFMSVKDRTEGQALLASIREREATNASN